MRRSSHADTNESRKEKAADKLYGARPLYFTSAAEPLIIETPIERKISRVRIEQQMAAVADAKPGTTSSTQRSTLKNGGSEKTAASDWESLDEPMEQKGILQSIRSYPKGVFFMLGNEFCERFSFYGMRAILIIYLTTEHHLSESVAKEIYHAFVSLAYLSPLLGSIMADNYFGRFKVILWVSLLYVLGHLLLSLGAIPILEVAIKRILDYSGLVVIAIATGGIKPCVSAFAADQFSENQHHERTQFFSFFYFAINAGSLIAIALTPLLRRVRCLDSEHCFPLAFGVPGVLMLLAFLTFLAGWRFYKITPASKGNILWRVVKCICYALRLKIRTKFSKKRRPSESQPAHWLDYAVPKYDKHLVAGVKSLLAVLLLFSPVVFFWALFDQQGSTWVLQARRMDGHVGWFTILPDQMNTFNPLMILILVPMFEAWFYPLMSRLFKVTPLRKMTVGAILTGIAFCIAGFVQMKINGTMEPTPAPGHAFVYRFGNSSTAFMAQQNNSAVIPASVGKYEIPTANYTFAPKGVPFEDEKQEFTLELATEKPKSSVVGIYQMDGKIQVASFPYTVEKTEEGKTRFYFLMLESSPFNGTTAYAFERDGGNVSSTLVSNGKFIDIQPGFFSASTEYQIGFDCPVIADGRPANCALYHEVTAQMGAAFVLDMVTNSTNIEMHQIVRSNSVTILWQLPQIFVITVGEILFAVTGLEFSYSQAAPSMKSVLQALWLQTVFFGNLIDIVISHLEIQEPATELFVYAAMMFAVIGIFIVLAMRYEYVDEHELELSEDGSPTGSLGEEEEKSHSSRKNLSPPKQEME